MSNSHRTKCDGVHFAFDLNGAVLTLVDVDTLFHFSLTDHHVLVVLLILLHSMPTTINYLFNTSFNVMAPDTAGALTRWLHFCVK